MRHLPRPVVALAAAVTLAACGGSGGTVTSEGEGSISASASGSGSASASGSTTASASGSSTASGSVASASCDPVNPELESDAAQTVAVGLADYAFELDSTDLAAGVTTFEAENVGDEPHELAFLPGGGDVPLTDDGAPDEAALEEAGAFELEAFPAGESCTATYDLEPGTYTLFCIVEAPGGETHAEKGMVTEITVS